MLSKNKRTLIVIALFAFGTLLLADASYADIFIPRTTLPDPQGGIAAILENFLKWVLGIFGVIALISFVISGLQYLFAVGDDDMAETAKKNMTYSIIGIVVALSGYIIIRTIEAFLKA